MVVDGVLFASSSWAFVKWLGVIALNRLWISPGILLNGSQTERMKNETKFLYISMTKNMSFPNDFYLFIINLYRRMSCGISKWEFRLHSTFDIVDQRYLHIKLINNQWKFQMMNGILWFRCLRHRLSAIFHSVWSLKFELYVWLIYKMDNKKKT